MSMGTEEKQEKGKEGRELYEKRSRKDPKRTIVPEKQEPKSLEEKEAEDPGLSALQTALKTLFPDIGKDAVDKALMMARIAPDMFIPSIRILVNDEIKKLDPHKPFSVAKTAMLYYILNSIGLDGKGRIDAIETTGSVKEAEELAELAKGFGGV